MPEVTPEYIKQHRRKLASQGAVDFFDYPTEQDRIASKVFQGLATGIPGAGLYRRSQGYYEMRLYAEELENSDTYGAWSEGTWRKLFAERGGRYISHRKQQGRGQGFWWTHILVRFEVQESNEEDDV